MSSSARGSVQAVERASRIDEAYGQARLALVTEGSLDRQYRLAPGDNLVVAHRRAAASLVDALNTILPLVDPTEQATIRNVRIMHDGYVASVEQIYSSSQTTGPLDSRVAPWPTDATLDTIQSQITLGADQHRADLLARLGALGTALSFEADITPVLILIGVGCIALFVAILQSYQRKIDDALRREKAHVVTLAETEMRCRALLANSSDVILVIDSIGTVVYLSPVAERYTPGLQVGASALDAILPEDHEIAREMVIVAAQNPGSDVSRELRVLRPDGSYRIFDVICSNQVAEPSIGGFVLTCHDMTQRKGFENRLKELAFLDPLTRLPNRAFFLDRIERAIVRSNDVKKPVAVMFLDLDNFKFVNDSLGHAVGDRLLVEVAERISASIRPEDVAARLGGDEFTILFEDVPDLANATRLATRIADAVRAPIDLAGHGIVVTTSIGIALSTPGLEQPGDLLRNADLAMYHAKLQGSALYSVFDQSMKTAALERMQLESDLRQAIERRSLELAYQPIVSLETNRVVELEALLRWHHPRRGQIAPTEFIPIAEETGLIVPLGRWVIEEACRQAKLWQELMPAARDVITCVNLSPRQVQAPTLVADIARSLAETGLTPWSLKIEVTEGAIMGSAEETIESLRELNRMGLRVAIDDFGTGYSSLSYLTRFAVDSLKIDRSFVSGMGHDDSNTAIARSIISLAKSLNLSVTGEGIETTDQLESLKAFGCDRGQGFLIAEPLLAEAVPAFLSGVGRGTIDEGASVAA